MTTRQRRRRESRRRQHSETSPTRRRLIAAGGLTAGATLAMAGSAQAAPMTFTVGSTADTAGAVDCATATNTDCTLRDAIIAANANSGADTIVFKSGVTGTITLIDDPVAITEALTVQGPGSADITVDGDGTYRTFYVDPNTAYDPVSISGLTLTNGYVGGGGKGGAVYNYDADLTISNAVISNSDAYGNNASGGGVYSEVGPLTIDSSTVSGNYAGTPTGTGEGGGIGSHSGEVTITNSTVSGNTAGNYSTDYNGAYGGGVFTNGANLAVDRSTINNNDARDGGGIYASYGDLMVTNSTITDNDAVSDDGGGVWVGDGALAVTSSTVTDNYAATVGGGLQSYNADDNVVRNTIVSGNTAIDVPDTADLGEDSELFDVAFSLIGVPAGHVNPTVPGSNLFAVDPELGPLQDNGGPTSTIEPLAESPVIDCGSDTANAFDQRGAGFPRVVNQPNRTGSTATGANNADMGAVEVAASASITGACTNNAPPAPPGPTPTLPANPGATGQRTAALNRCKKKHKNALKKKKAQDALTQPVKKGLNKKFKKCKRKANQLPV
jgi:hypothetical protein